MIFLSWRKITFCFFLELISTFKKLLRFLFTCLSFIHLQAFSLHNKALSVCSHIRKCVIFCPFSSSCPNLDWSMLVILSFSFPSVSYFPLSSSLVIFLFFWVHNYFIHLLPFLWGLRKVQVKLSGGLLIGLWEHNVF